MLNLEQNFRNYFGAASLPVLDKIFLDAIETAEDPRSKLFHMESMDREITQTASTDSLGLFSQTSEAEQAPSDSFNQSYSKTFTAVKYTKKIGISDEMIADDKLGQIAKMVKSLARSAKETQNVNAMSVFNNAFTTQLGWDGVALMSASHPTQVGNQSNLIASPADLSVSSLQEAETIFRSFKDNRGKRLLMRPKILLVSESDRHNALEIVQSPYKANTANNNINSLGADGGLTVISSPYLTDADAWFLLAGPEEMSYGLKIFDREGIKTVTHEDVLAGVLYYKAQYRQAIGVDEWRGVAGSAGV